MARVVFHDSGGGRDRLCLTQHSNNNNNIYAYKKIYGEKESRTHEFCFFSFSSSTYVRTHTHTRANCQRHFPRCVCVCVFVACAELRQPREGGTGGVAGQGHKTGERVLSLILSSPRPQSLPLHQQLQKEMK